MDDFEEIYGTKHFVEPPHQNLQSSLKSTLETEDIDFVCASIEECGDMLSGFRNSKSRKRTAIFLTFKKRKLMKKIVVMKRGRWDNKCSR